MPGFPDFDTYVVREHGGWVEGEDRCGDCDRKAPRVTADGDRRCEWCVREHYGYDKREPEIRQPRNPRRLAQASPSAR
jgi:hypothetical protein